MIRLHALGTVELRRGDGVAVSSITAQPKRLALLVYLAVARPPGFHRRDTLLGLFWPESPEGRARSALGQALYFLRRSLGEDVIPGRGHEEVGVAPERLWCDVTALWEALAADEVERALTLCRGELLPGVHLSGCRAFEEWLHEERSSLRRAVLEAVSAHARTVEEVDPGAAAELLRRALAIAPEDETVLRRLMVILDAMGDRAGALAAFEAFAHRLAVDLEIEPSPETLALRDAIAGRTEARPSAAEVRPVAVSALTASPTEPGSPSPGRVHASPSGAVPSSVSARRRWLPRIAALVLPVVALVGMALWTGRTSGPALNTPAPFTLAVAPFAVPTPDTGLVRIARELVVPLSANLDGLGDVRAVEGMQVLEEASEGEARDAALALARRLGATRVLYGAIVAAGPAVRVEATLRRVVDGERVLHASVVSERNASAVADTLTWAVLRELWSGHAAAVDSSRVSPPEPVPVALATTSIPALRAYWEGERAVAQDRWRDAAEHYAHAITLDTTYWAAYWRYGYVRMTTEAPVDPQIRAGYERNRFAFRERDRLMIEARMADSLSERLALHRELTRRYPRYWLAWWDYANRLVHEGPLLGFTTDDAREALEHALALRPNDVIVLQHLFWMAAQDEDLATMEAVVRRTQELRAASPDFVPPVPDLLSLFEMTLAAAGRDPEAFERVSASTLASLAVAGRGPMGDRFSMGVGSYGFHAAQIDFARRALASGAPPEVQGAQRRGIALAWAARGAWDSAVVAADAYVLAVDGPAPLQHALRLGTVGAWLGAVPMDVPRRWRAELVPYETRLEPPHVAELAWLDGIRGAVLGRADSVAAARARLQRLSRMADVGGRPPVLPPAGEVPDLAWVPRILDASLAGFEHAVRGDTVAAAESLAELERRRAEHGWARAPAQWHPWVTALDRMAAGRWLRDAGRARDAEKLLAWVDAVEASAYLAGEANATMDALASYQRALVAEDLGEPRQVRRHLARFLRRYDLPVPAHVEWVERARRALAASGGS